MKLRSKGKVGIFINGEPAWAMPGTIFTEKKKRAEYLISIEAAEEYKEPEVVEAGSPPKKKDDVGEK